MECGWGVFGWSVVGGYLGGVWLGVFDRLVFEGSACCRKIPLRRLSVIVGRRDSMRYCACITASLT